MKVIGRHPRLAVVGLAAVALGACSGGNGGTGQPSVKPDGGAAGATGAAGTGGIAGMGAAGDGGAADMPPVNTACRQVQAAPVYAAMLSPTQYDNTVFDLFKLAGDPAKDFGGGSATQLDELGVERRANAAEDLAHRAAASLAVWAPCQVPPAEAAACEQQIIDRVGPRAYRRPLSADERAELVALFDAGINEKDFATGVEWLLTGVFQSPDFLYQLVRPAADEQPGQVRPLGGYELASRLAYFLWDSMPDDQLEAAAAAGTLADPAGLGGEIARLVADPRFLRGVTGFYTGWLKLGSFASVARDDGGFTSDVVASLQTSLLASATHLYEQATPNIASLFSGDSYYLNPTLRTFYGLPAVAGTDFAPTPMTGQGRRGILTHPALMALLARPTETNPIARGLFIRRTVMCQTVPPPPSGVAIPPLPPISPGLSTRERLDQHTQNAQCAFCHDSIDPPGFAFEAFDQVGRRRATDGGKPVDTSGDLRNGGDMTGPFASGDELLVRIAKSRDVRRCFAEQTMAYAVGRPLVAQDQCALDAVADAFAASGDLKALLVGVAASDAFRHRQAEGAAP